MPQRTRVSFSSQRTTRYWRRHCPPLCRRHKFRGTCPTQIRVSSPPRDSPLCATTSPSPMLSHLIRSYGFNETRVSSPPRDCPLTRTAAPLLPWCRRFFMRITAALGLLLQSLEAHRNMCALDIGRRFHVVGVQCQLQRFQFMLKNPELFNQIQLRVHCGL